MDNVAMKSDKTAQQIQNEVRNIPNFCREEASIAVTDLIGYVGDGITLYYSEDTMVRGVINFEVNVDIVNIQGLCAVEPSAGVGTALLNSVKTFAEINKMKKIKLTCYGNVVGFYERNGFRIQSQRVVMDEDDEDEDEEPKTRYDLAYEVIYGGKKDTKKSKKKSTKSKRKSMKSKRHTKKSKGKTRKSKN